MAPAHSQEKLTFMVRPLNDEIHILGVNLKGGAVHKSSSMRGTQFHTGRWSFNGKTFSSHYLLLKTHQRAFK